MTEAEESEAIERTRRSDNSAAEYVHSSDPGARNAFLEGRVLFDVTHDGRRFEQFFRANEDLRDFALRTHWIGWWGENFIDSRTHARILMTAHKTAYDRRYYLDLQFAGLAVKDPMDPAVLRRLAFHEIGRLAMRYWRRELISWWHGFIDIATGTGGATGGLPGALSESDLMVILGGPLAEYLSLGVVPKKAIRFAGEYKDPDSDSSRLRALVMKLRGGEDDLFYQFQIQERCREVMQRPEMWAAITEAAETLAVNHGISGRRCEEVFVRNRAPQRKSGG